MAKAFSSYGDLATAGWAWPPALMSVNGVVIVSASPEGSLNRRCSRSQPATPARANNTAASSGKRKHIQHPALRRGRRQVTHCIGPATVGARIARVEIACHHGAAPHRKILAYLPGGALRDRVPGLEHAAIPARPRIHLHVRAQVRRSLDVVSRSRLLVLAQVLVRDIDEAGLRRVRSRLPVLATTGVRTNVVHHFADNWLLGLDEAKSARGEIHACRRVDVNEWRRRQHLAGQPVEYVEVAIAAGTGRDLARLAIDGEIEQQALIDRVVIKQIMRTLLVKPARLTGIGLTS